MRENNYDAIGHLRANPGITEKIGGGGRLGVVHFNNFRRHRLDGKRQRREILELGWGGGGQGHASLKDYSHFSL